MSEVTLSGMETVSQCRHSVRSTSSLVRQFCETMSITTVFIPSALFVLAIFQE